MVLPPLGRPVAERRCGVKTSWFVDPTMKVGPRADEGGASADQLLQSWTDPIGFIVFQSCWTVLD